MLRKGSGGQALEQLQDAAVEYVDILGPASQADSNKPLPGSPDSMLPRFRMDRAVAEVLGGLRADRPPNDGRTPAPAAGPPSDVDRARAALSRRDWDDARQILESPSAADHRGPAPFLLARAEFELGHLDVAGDLLDDFLARRPRHPRARALRAQVRLRAGDQAGALAEAEEALKIDPTLVAARRVLFDVTVAQRLA
jgi:tetratricopeptide (TPR) repeat protein